MQAGTTRKTKDSAGRRLGVKKFGNAEVFPMDILVRQRGFKWHPGKNTYVGRDHTIHAKTEGIVSFTRDPWRQRKKVYVHVEPQELPSRRKYLTSPPPPYCYHPELYPELAKNNPAPTNFRLPEKSERKVKSRTVGMKSDKKQNTVNIRIPEEFITREQVEIPSASEQYITYLSDVDQNFNTSFNAIDETEELLLEKNEEAQK